MMGTRTRPKVALFAEAMEARLKHHEDKHPEANWEDKTSIWLHNRLKASATELSNAIEDPKSTAPKILRLCADVANYAMFIADVRGAFKAS